MQQWFVFEVDEAALSGGTFHRLCRQFQHAFMEAGAPSDMALFGEYDDASGRRYLFLSPESREHVADLIDTYQGSPCAPPQPDGLTLLYGRSDAARRCWKTNGRAHLSVAG